MNNNSPFIFISYAHLDIDTVLPIINALKTKKFNVWYDSGIEAGTEWPEFIAEKIMDSTVVVAFLSKNSLNSHNCRREINFAIETQKELLVVYLEDLDLTPGMRMQLNTLQAMHKTRSATEEDFIQAICEAKLLQPCRDSEKNFVEEPAPTLKEPLIEIPKHEKEPAKQSTPSSPVNSKKQLINRAVKHVRESYEIKGFDFVQKCNAKEKQITTAIKKYAPNVSPDEVLYIYDTTIMGSGKTGFIITENAVYSSEKSVGCIRFEEIKDLSLEKSYININTIDDSYKHLYFSIYAEKFFALFNYIKYRK